MSVSRETVLNWFRTGSEDASDIVNLPWDVKQLDESTYLAEHPRIPFRLLVKFAPGFVSLVVPTNLETSNLPNVQKLAVYQTLLNLNEMVYMMKFTLMEPNQTVALRVDLSTETLGKEEFNDALTALAIGLLTGVMALGLEEEFVNRVMERILDTLREKVREGYTYDQLLEFLTVRVGLREDDAKDLLNEVLKSMSDEFERS